MDSRIKEDFARDVAGHVMTVIREDGVYRHLRFSKPGTRCYQFDLITWPGYLCYCGDMGTYVFERTEDMLEFFRRPEHCRYSIDRRYWAEKVRAGDRSGSGDSIFEFSTEKFTRVINQYRVTWMRQAQEFGALDKAERRELWEAVQEDVLRRLEDGEHLVCAAAYEFSWSAGPNHPHYQFDDLFEHDFKEYTHSFNWCCQALNWAVQVYDKAKEKIA